MSVPSSLDYSLLTTWQTIDRETACLRIGQNPNNTCNPGAIEVATTLYDSLKSEHITKLFFKSEQMDLRGGKFYKVYKVDCNQDHVKFVQYILNFKLESKEESGCLLQ